MRASCQCGQLQVKVPGPTMAVVACHCVACQKRSGSPFGEAADYPHDQVKIEGETRQFSRSTNLGGTFDQFFCADCGTTVFMRGTKYPEVTGIPIGLFDDAHTKQPVRSVWEDRKHPWVEIPTAMQHFSRARVDRSSSHLEEGRHQQSSKTNPKSAVPLTIYLTTVSLG